MSAENTRLDISLGAANIARTTAEADQREAESRASVAEAALAAPKLPTTVADVLDAAYRASIASAEAGCDDMSPADVLAAAQEAAKGAGDEPAAASDTPSDDEASTDETSAPKTEAPLESDSTAESQAGATNSPASTESAEGTEPAPETIPATFRVTAITGEDGKVKKKALVPDVDEKWGKPFITLDKDRSILSLRWEVEGVTVATAETPSPTVIGDTSITVIIIPQSKTAE